MVKQELVQRSPMRILEKSMHGGLKAGEIGIVSSKKGIGKTAVLVQIALDKLMQGQKVIHVSFSQLADYVNAWYEDIFQEISKKKNLENADEVKAETVKNRVLMNFNQDSLSTDQILKSLSAMIVDGGFTAQALIVDGYDFSKTDGATMKSIKDFAAKLGLEVWFSCTVSDTESVYDKKTLPEIIKKVQEEIDVIVVLDPKADFIQFNVAKDHKDYHPASFGDLKLDAKTLLVAEK